MIKLTNFTTLTTVGFAGLSILLIMSVLLTNSSYAASPSSTQNVLPDLRPVMDDLLNYDLVKDPNTGQILLRFGGSIGNYSDGPLEIVGKRTIVDPNNNEMPAYQRIYKTDGTFNDVLVGTLIYHPEHHHFHFQSAMQYDLLDQKNTIITSQKQSFCLADVSIVDSTLPYFSNVPVYNRCYHDPSATFVKMGISVGWDDIYDKSLVGQAMDVTDLMQKPKQTYYLKETTNPQKSLIEKNKKPQEISIPVEIGIGVPVGVGQSRPGV